ncbi:MAG: hypothetical protein RIS76_1184, partial [Verrucomicrobiota bacterium]
TAAAPIVNKRYCFMAGNSCHSSQSRLSGRRQSFVKELSGVPGTIRNAWSATPFRRPRNETVRPIPQIRALGGIRSFVRGLLSRSVPMGRRLPRHHRRGDLPGSLHPRASRSGGTTPKRPRTSSCQHPTDERRLSGLVGSKSRQALFGGNWLFDALRSARRWRGRRTLEARVRRRC